MTRLLCIRHAESIWNAEGRWQGQADPPLSERGRAAAAAAASRLEGAVERVVSSHLARASETARIIAEALGAPWTTDPDLSEIDVGEWSGLTRDEIESRWPGGHDAWRAGTFVPPGAEDPAAFVARVTAALERAAGDPRPALVVTHGGAIGRLERKLGVHPGPPVPCLSGRWFEIASEMTALGDRVDLLSR